jgi:hypothetical protein
MARKGDSLKEMVNSEGTDKYAAGAYTVAGDTLFGPIYAIMASGACVITVLKDSEGEDILTNYVANAVPLAAGETIFFRVPVYSITITVAPALVYYISQKKLS